MRFVASAVACAGLCLVIAGCDPVTDRQYFTKGVGSELYAADVATQTDLQNLYVDHICQQAGLPAGACGPANFDVATWTLFVQAGMNDIDQRCDAYLTWLDNVRRSEAPALKQITDMGTATTLIMQATGVEPGPMAIVAAAFGLASNTFTNINSRLILQVNHATVQAVVLQRQQRYREDLFGTATNRSQAIISSRPAAVYALRSYLRLCMPMTIETEINNTVTTFERGGAAALQISRPMISAKSVGATVIRDATAGPATRIKTAVVFEDAGNLLRTWLRPNGAVDRERVAVIEKFIAEKKYDPPPQVTTFLRGAAFTDGRVELARRLGLIR